jgi:hypothetical protein
MARNDNSMTRSYGRPKQEKEIKIMKKPNIIRFTIALVFLAASTSLVWSQAATTANTVLGVWGVTRHPVNCQTGQELSTFPALMTFHQDGTVSGQSYGPFPENAYGPAEHGVWHNAPGNTFSFRLLSYGYDDNGQFTGSTIVTATGQLTSANTFSYSSSIQIYDADGHLLVTLCGHATATRFE